MSKSLGTGIDPIDLIEGGQRPPVFAQGTQPAGEFPAYGADAVRWGLMAMSSGQDVRFSEDKVAQGQQLTNKLWNASRLILLGVGEQARAAATPNAVEDRWMLSRLARAQAEVSQRIEQFDFSHAALALYEFVYGELCDWYLELVKPRLRAGEPELAGTLLHVLTETIALAHPLIPFETEEIYSHIPGAEGLLAARISEPPGPDVIDTEAERAVERAIAAVQALRRWRALEKVEAGAMLPVRLAADGYDETSEHLARLARVTLDGSADAVATVPVPGGAIEILASPDVDLGASARRIEAERDKLSSEIERAERKLSNQGFVAKAPPEVVAAERDKLERLREELEAL
jgi:valyl-tRNA synthetase